MDSPPFSNDSPIVGIIMHNTPKVNEKGIIIIPQDVFRPKPTSWPEDYIAACMPYHLAFDKRCWDKDQKPILGVCLTINSYQPNGAYMRHSYIELA